MRAALIQSGLNALETSNGGEVSLRQVARDVGVSATAVYRHFPDKAALMGAMAEVGVEMLGQFQEQATRQAASTGEAFDQSGRAYVRFALAHPALFRLISANPKPGGIAIFGDSLPARMLQGYASTFRKDEAEAQRMMLQAWAVVHGLAFLMLEGRLPKEDGLIDHLIDMNTMFHLAEGSSSEASP